MLDSRTNGATRRRLRREFSAGIGRRAQWHWAFAFVLSATASLAQAQAQDLAVVAIDAPASGCSLGAGESVTIRIFNYGSTLPAGKVFNVAYTINAGAPVTEMTALGQTLLSHSTFAYTFVTLANLSVPGTYTFDATVNLPGDVNPTNNAYTGYVVSSSAPTVAGAVSGSGGPTLAGAVTLSGRTGDILEWQQSEDGGRRWRRLANTGAMLAFANLRRDTLFRALVRSGECPAQLSNALLVQSSDPIFYSGFEP